MSDATNTPNGTEQKPVVTPKKDDFVAEMQVKRMKYEFIEDYSAHTDLVLGDSFIFKKWAYGHCITLLPIALEVTASLAQFILPGEASIDTKNLTERLLENLTRPSVARELSKQLSNIKELIAKSIQLSAKENGLVIKTPDQTYAFVDQLELEDTIGICLVLYKQNLESHIKKVMPQNAKGPSEEPGPQSKSQ